MRKILLLAANPRGTEHRRLDQEARDISQALERAKLRDKFSITPCWAVQVRDIRRKLLDLDPHIIHFSGYGAGVEGLYFEDETGGPKLVDGEALANLFKLFKNIECVILNGCYSERQATVISRFIPYVIGMGGPISSKAAIEFAVGFYDGLGAGQSFDFSYHLGCNAIQMAGLLEDLQPILKKKSDVEKIEPNLKVIDMQSKSSEVFISYAEVDERLCQQLESHLSGMQKDGSIRVWHRGKRLAGSFWQQERNERLNSADVILLLVTVSLFADNYCEFELEASLKRHHQGEALVIPIILRACEWEATSLGQLTPLPKDGKPVMSGGNRDDSFLKIVKGIRERIQAK